MNYKYIAALALLGASTLACADESKPTNFYVEAGYIHLNVDVSGVGDDDLGVGMLKFGYNAHENLAIEMMAGTGFSDIKESGCLYAYGDTYCGSYKAKLSYAIGVYLKPKFKLGDAEIFARLGYTHAEVKEKVSVDGYGSESVKSDDGDFSFGAGVSYSFTKQVYASIDYMRYYDRKGTELSGPSISIGYKF
jgi:hypothetical protein